MSVQPHPSEFDGKAKGYARQNKHDELRPGSAQLRLGHPEKERKPETRSEVCAQPGEAARDDVEFKTSGHSDFFGR